MSAEVNLHEQVAALSAQVAALSKVQQSAGGISADQLEMMMTRIAKVQSDAHLAAMKEIAERDRRDDINYPRISVFSYPEGDKARPRDPFKCKMFWCGYDLDHDTTTAEELDLLNLVEPGEYTFRRISGIPESISVTGERNASGKLSKLDFTFPTKENRDTLPSMLSMLRDLLGVKSAEQLEIDRLRKELEAMKVQKTKAA